MNELKLTISLLPLNIFECLETQVSWLFIRRLQKTVYFFKFSFLSQKIRKSTFKTFRDSEKIIKIEFMFGKPQNMAQLEGYSS